MTDPSNVHRAFDLARERYEGIGVDVDSALQRLRDVAISVHCWQGDDVVGFEGNDGALGNGLAVTGNYPGRARTADELRNDLELAYSLIPGNHRLNLHALYGEFDGPVDRDEIGVEHFQGWIDWGRSQGVSLDFNPSYFSHQKAGDGFQALSSVQQRRCRCLRPNEMSKCSNALPPSPSEWFFGQHPTQSSFTFDDWTHRCGA